MKTILYATDYSQNSVAALLFANALAKKLDAQSVVMHVFDLPFSLASPVSIFYLEKEKKLFVEHRVKLENFCVNHLGDNIKESPPKIVVVKDGSVVNGILEKALQANADLIVVGAKGTSILKEFFLGSTAKMLIKKATIPILAVPKDADPEYLSVISYASDFEEADIFAIRKLVKIGQSFDAQIRILHITTPKEYAGDQQMEWFKEILLKKVTYEKLKFDLIFSENVFEELQKYLKESDIDLLAMLQRKDNTYFKKYSQRDLVRQMVSEITVPLLSFNQESL